MTGSRPQFVHSSRLSITDTGALHLVVESLLRGEVAAFPTDTVYGLGAHALSAEGVAALFALKQRPLHLPIPLLLPDKESMSGVCASIPAGAWRLADAFWPGGLSLVLERAPLVPDIVAAGGATVAIRVPDQHLLRELCTSLGAPLAATSANRHGRPAPTTADEVETEYGGLVRYILDGGRCPGGIASTVLDLTQRPARILRQGPVTLEQLAVYVPVA